MPPAAPWSASSPGIRTLFGAARGRATGAGCCRRPGTRRCGSGMPPAAPCPRDLTGHTDAVRGCAWSSDGRWVLSASRDETLRIWDAASGAMVREPHRAYGRCCGLRVVERRALAAVGVCGQHAADLGCRQRRHGPRAHRAYGHCLGLRVVERRALGAVGVQGRDAADLGCRQRRHGPRAHRAYGRCFGLRVVERRALAAVGVWGQDAADLGCRQRRHASAALTGHTDAVFGCAWSSDGRWVLSASRDKTLRIWDAASGAMARELTGHTDTVWGCAWSSDGRWVLSASRDETLRIWDAASGAMVRELTGHTDAVVGCAWSSDGAGCCRRLRTTRCGSGMPPAAPWSASSPGIRTMFGAARGRATGMAAVGVWGQDAADLGCRQRRHASAHSPGIRTLFGAARGRATGAGCCRRLGTRRCGSGMPPAAPWSASLTGHRGGVWGCAWSSDGRWVLSASGDETLRIWDAASGAMVREPHRA